MGFDFLKSEWPTYAKDLRLNLSVLTTSNLDSAGSWGQPTRQRWYPQNATVKAAILDEAGDRLSPELIEGCKSAEALMSVNNVWYKFNDLVSDTEIKGQPAKPRMNSDGVTRRGWAGSLRDV